jgi:hypothetical protein
MTVSQLGIPEYRRHEIRFFSAASYGREAGPKGCLYRHELRFGFSWKSAPRSCAESL